MKHFEIDKRGIYIQNKVNSEHSYTRNNGVLHAIGEFIIFLNNDDFLLNKVESQLKYLKSICNVIRII